MPEMDKVIEYDRIADYLRECGWRVTSEWKHPGDGSVHESWQHPDNGPSAFHDILSAYRIECVKDSPGQTERTRRLLTRLTIGKRG